VVVAYPQVSGGVSSDVVALWLGKYGIVGAWLGAGPHGGEPSPSTSWLGLSATVVMSCQHAYELVASHGETALTAHLLPFTVDGEIWTTSIVALDASRRDQRVPPPSRAEPGDRHRWPLSRQSGTRPWTRAIGALVSAWPALALVASFGLLAFEAARRGSANRRRLGDQS
jgi:hypothetical protein